LPAVSLRVVDRDCEPAVGQRFFQTCSVPPVTWVGITPALVDRDHLGLVRIDWPSDRGWQIAADVQRYDAIDQNVITLCRSVSLMPSWMPTPVL